MKDITLVLNGNITNAVAAVLPYLKVSEEWSSGRSSVDDIVRFIITGQMQLWLVFDQEKVYGHFITEIKEYPQAKFLTIQYCAMEPGTMESVEDKMQEYTERFAKDAGCIGIEFIGRPGWRRVANTRDYDLQSVIYQKIFKE
jgi:hypothetical protein